MALRKRDVQLVKFGNLNLFSIKTDQRRMGGIVDVKNATTRKGEKDTRERKWFNLCVADAQFLTIPSFDISLL
jgi:hypothetical protein